MPNPRKQPWTKAENEFLTENYEDYSHEELSFQLKIFSGRDIGSSAVGIQCRNIGLKPRTLIKSNSRNKGPNENAGMINSFLTGNL